MTCFWHKELTQIANIIVNKIFQDKRTTIDRSVKHINHHIKEIKSTKESVVSDESEKQRP